MQKKNLTRLRLVNWHYFENETIHINGSTLISGENTAGKSTILDAIQLVLTTNTRRFNAAANEKGNRDLRGYVRCKIGTLDQMYLRKNAVISHVCLEFYETKTDNYFVLGVFLSSHDEESTVVAKWYIEECRLEDITFLTGDRPSYQEEFTINGKKVQFIDQKNAARERFKRRLGNLDDKFFDVIPKSLAFKPMDNVKDFINKFVLTESGIDVQSLRTNIETLSELEELFRKTQKKLEILESIEYTFEQIQKKDNDILINELLLAKASIDDLETTIRDISQKIIENTSKLNYLTSTESELKNNIENLASQLVELNIALRNNESSRLVEDAEREIVRLQRQCEVDSQNIKKLQEHCKKLEKFLRLSQKMGNSLVEKADFDVLLQEVPAENKLPIFQTITKKSETQIEDIQEKKYSKEYEIKNLDETIGNLQKRLQDLQLHKKFEYPKNTVLLQSAIQKEFSGRGIDSTVHILCDLLSITDSIWQNAVEGYLNTQKFYLVVEPKYYDIALQVYQSQKKHIHSVGIINTKKIEESDTVDFHSLAYVVESDNRYAKRYINFLLGRVVRCDSIGELENYSIGITKDCMLYQGYVVRRLSEDSYKNPYIGHEAYEIQIKNLSKEIEENSLLRKEKREQKIELDEIISAYKLVKFDLIEEYLDSPYRFANNSMQEKNVQKELLEAKNNPEFTELSKKIDSVSELKRIKETERDVLLGEHKSLEIEISHGNQFVEAQKIQLQELIENYAVKSDENSQCKIEAEEKYEKSRKTKDAKTVFENFKPKTQQLYNEKEKLLSDPNGLKDKQQNYNHLFETDFIIGVQGMESYIGEKYKIASVQIIQFEEKLRTAKEQCENIFKTEFLAKMKENIENAITEFRLLNRSLKGICYGDDEYKFIVDANKKKETLYKMITSDDNQQGMNLWRDNFESTYKHEMEDLFAKLVAKDDNGDALIKEYTDYRTYLDYDIEITKTDGSKQRFSAIYKEKSGSETQVPYYVAIGASFYQLYRNENTVRVILLDEAFDKMDDERIASMMDFFNSLELQVLLATPPAKIEVIGEKVETILTAFRDDKHSFVEEWTG